MTCFGFSPPRLSIVVVSTYSDLTWKDFIPVRSSFVFDKDRLVSTFVFGVLEVIAEIEVNVIKFNDYAWFDW